MAKKKDKQSIEARGGSHVAKCEIARVLWGRKGGSHGNPKARKNKKACRRFKDSDGW